jgi:molybdate transport system substrate-binding protein
MRGRAVRLGAFALAAIVAASACGTAPQGSGLTPTSSAGSLNLTVYAAASLTDVLADVRTAYEAARPGVTLTIATDSSATLATQIELGAPADVFLSADTSNPKRLVDDGLAVGGAVNFAGNGLAVIVPSGNPAGITSPADLARPGVKVIAAGDAVPISGYAMQLVSALANLPGYPAGFVAGYTANIVSREDNVKAVVAKIELGEGDAGIVYRTDARASTKVATIAIPDAVHVAALYAGLVVRSSTHAVAAAAFLGWLAGSDGQAILARDGFGPPA